MGFETAPMQEGRDEGHAEPQTLKSKTQTQGLGFRVILVQRSLYGRTQQPSRALQNQVRQRIMKRIRVIVWEPIFVGTRFCRIPHYSLIKMIADNIPNY